MTNKTKWKIGDYVYADSDIFDRDGRAVMSRDQFNDWYCTEHEGILYTEADNIAIRLLSSTVYRQAHLENRVVEAFLAHIGSEMGPFKEEPVRFPFLISEDELRILDVALRNRMGKIEDQKIRLPEARHEKLDTQWLAASELQGRTSEAIRCLKRRL